LDAIAQGRSLEALPGMAERSARRFGIRASAGRFGIRAAITLAALCGRYLPAATRWHEMTNRPTEIGARAKTSWARCNPVHNGLYGFSERVLLSSHLKIPQV